MVHFMLDRLRKTEVKQLLNKLSTDHTWTLNGTMHGPFHFTYARTMHMLQLNFTCVKRRYLLRISNSAVCNQDVERDSVLKP